jgi:sugar phosphate isomerase/epimerase
LNRLMPGDGDFDLHQVLRVFDDMAALRWVGPEVISPSTESMPRTEAAAVAKQRVVDLIASTRAAARSSVPLDQRSAR